MSHATTNAPPDTANNLAALANNNSIAFSAGWSRWQSANIPPTKGGIYQRLVQGRVVFARYGWAHEKLDVATWFCSRELAEDASQEQAISVNTWSPWRHRSDFGPSLQPAERFQDF